MSDEAKLDKLQREEQWTAREYADAKLSTEEAEATWMAAKSKELLAKVAYERASNSYTYAFAQEHAPVDSPDRPEPAIDALHPPAETQANDQGDGGSSSVIPADDTTTQNPSLEAFLAREGARPWKGATAEDRNPDLPPSTPVLMFQRDGQITEGLAGDAGNWEWADVLRVMMPDLEELHNSAEDIIAFCPIPALETSDRGEGPARLGDADTFLTSIIERGGTWHDGGGNPVPNWFCDIYVPAASTSLGDEALHLEGQPSNAYIWSGWEVAYIPTAPMFAQPSDPIPQSTDEQSDPPTGQEGGTYPVSEEERREWDEGIDRLEAAANRISEKLHTALDQAEAAVISPEARMFAHGLVADGQRHQEPSFIEKLFIGKKAPA
jgi:hypothetical protein